MRKKILFLCTGNSCRSQMAEGSGRKYAPEAVEIHSAGIRPIGVHPLAVQIMTEIGIDISDQYSKGPDEVPSDIDTVVSVCDNARQQCPNYPGNVERIHWSIEDPYYAQGTQDQILDKFREVREDLGQRVKELLSPG
ncbi:MAG: arsenate reductase ArsC [Armatimonadetes bacterium]|nr:arsenate reductase ArsC [Armatimonadota bacterium]